MFVFVFSCNVVRSIAVSRKFCLPFDGVSSGPLAPVVWPSGGQSGPVARYHTVGEKSYCLELYYAIIV